jgi:UDP-N-acetylmuramoylalanine--D-glutamate ligase
VQELLKGIHDWGAKVVVEVPSFQLELVSGMKMRAPKATIITNLYQDHLNRHGTMEGYAKAKANIFANQTEEDYLILNKDNEWTEYFLGLKPRTKVLMIEDNEIWSKDELARFALEWGEHNVKNLLFASLAANALGVTPESIKENVKSLPSIKFRQEKVYESDNLTIWNDTAATSPEATIAAVARFASLGTILLTGGTDRNLEYSNWGRIIDQNLPQEKVVFLSGSATEKMKQVLSWEKYQEFDTLEECVDCALNLAGEFECRNILFSPSAKSFEKFKNEFDRGEKFNALIKQKLTN